MEAENTYRLGCGDQIIQHSWPIVSCVMLCSCFCHLELVMFYQLSLILPHQLSPTTIPVTSHFLAI